MLDDLKNISIEVAKQGWQWGSDAISGKVRQQKLFSKPGSSFDVNEEEKKPKPPAIFGQMVEMFLVNHISIRVT